MECGRGQFEHDHRAIHRDSAGAPDGADGASGVLADCYWQPVGPGMQPESILMLSTLMTSPFSAPVTTTL